MYLPCSSYLLNLVNTHFRMGNFENVHHALNGLLQLCSVFSELLALFNKRGGLACFAFPFFLRKKVSVVLVLAMGDFQVEDH